MGILLVYDVSDEKSFRNVSNWIKQIEMNASPDVNTMLVGNKCDVSDEDRVSSPRIAHCLSRERLLIQQGQFDLSFVAWRRRVRSYELLKRLAEPLLSSVSSLACVFLRRMGWRMAVCVMWLHALSVQWSNSA